jgi:hypothetical protein
MAPRQIAEPTVDVCSMCFDTLNGECYYHSLEACPFQKLCDWQRAVPFCHCHLCISGLDCPLHPCPLCEGPHVRSECTCPPDTIELLQSRFVARLFALGQAWEEEAYEDEEEWPEEPEAGGLAGALRALTVDDV